MDKYNILISNVQIDSANKGCSALAYSILFLIDEIMQEHGQPYNLYLSNYKVSDKERKIEIGNRILKYSEYSSPLPLSLKGLIYNIIFLKKTLRNVKILQNAKIRLDIGEGDSFSDIYGTHRFNLINRFHKLSKIFKIPYILLPQTIGPFASQKIKKEAKRSMENAKLVMSRDKTSADFAKTIVDRVKIDEYIDLAFLLPYAPCEFDRKKFHVGINVSALLWNGGYTKDNQFRLKINYQELITETIRTLMNVRDDIQIHLIPHVLDLSSESIENDYKVLTDIFKSFNDPRITLAPAFFNPIEAKNYIGGMDFFLGARMHAAIAAFSSRVPVLPMAYSRKFNGLFKETLDYPYLIDLKCDSQEEIVKKIIEGLKNAKTMRLSIDRSHEQIINKRITKLKRDLSEILFTNED